MSMSPHFKALLSLAAAAATLGATAPVVAKAAAPGANEIRMKVMRGKGETLYCVTDAPLPGTRLPTRLCLDRAGWARQGIDIPLAEARQDEAKPAAKG